MLRVFTFRPDWGLPSTGPFALKLLAWLGLAGIAYEQVIEDDAGRGPAGKSPWVELDGELIADSARIIETLGRRMGFDLDAGLDTGRRAEARMWMRGFEEGFHQVFEWELLIHPAGARYIDGLVASLVPPLVSGPVAGWVRARFARQLHARGIARHAPWEIAAIGIADLEALAARLEDRPFLVADRPVMADLAVFGQVAPMVRWPMSTPVAAHAKSRPAIVAFVERVEALCLAPGARE